MKNTKGLKRGGSPGRPKGIPNKTTKAIRELATALLNRESYQASLQQRLDEGKAPHMEVLLYHYAHGKPRETMKHEGLQPAQLVVTRINTQTEMRALLAPPDLDAGDDEDDDT